MKRWIKNIFRWKASPKTTPFVFKSPETKLFQREVEVDTPKGKITLKNLTYVQSLIVEGQVEEVKKAMAERGFDKDMQDVAARNMRLTMVLFLSCHSNGKPLFQSPDELGSMMDAEMEMKLWIAYTENFILSEEERGNWWRDKLQSSPT